MAAVWMWLRAEARARWRAWLGLALLMGAAGGAVVAAAAGARRTDTAYERMVAAQNGADVVLFDDGYLGIDVDLDAVSRLPQVASVARGSLIYYMLENQAAVAAIDERLGATVNRFKLLEGRRYDPTKAEEVVLGFSIARRLGLRVGSTFPMFDAEQTAELPEAAALNITFKVVGVVAAPGDFPPQFVGLYPSIHLTPAFWSRYGNFTAPDVATDKGTLFVRLKRGRADAKAFIDAVGKLSRGPTAFVQTAGEIGTLTDRAFHFQGLGLALLALFGGVAAILVFGQALARQAILGSGEFPKARALGLDARQLWAIGLIRAALIGIVAAAVGIVVAVALSPLTPFGDARIAEPAPGLAFDAKAIGLGAAAIVALSILISALPTRRSANVFGGALGTAGTLLPRSSRAVAVLTRARLPAPAVVGSRLALESGRGASAVPVRSTLTGLTVGIAVFAAALTFGASLDHLLARPELYGVRWDVTVSNFGEGPDVRENLDAIEGIPGIAELSIGADNFPVRMGAETVPVAAMKAIRGGAVAPIVAGRAPTAPDEIALAARTLRRLSLRIGDRTTLDAEGTGGSAASFTVVGKTAISPTGTASSFPGEGALVTLEGVARLGETKLSQVFIRYVPGADRAGIDKALGPLMGLECTCPAVPETPADIVNFGRVQRLPLLLGGILGLVAALTLAHLVASAVSRRRRDLAILKTMGFVRRQIRGTVAAQATILVAIALAVGTPTGVALGRWTWTAFAEELGMVPRPVVPAAATALIVPGALLLANLIAALPGQAAARLRPALVLRSE